MRRKNIELGCIQLYSFYYHNTIVNGSNSSTLSTIDIDYLKEKIKNSVPRKIRQHSGKKAKTYNYTNSDKLKFIKFLNRERYGVNYGEIKVFFFITILLSRVLTEKSKGANYFKNLCRDYLKTYIYKDDISLIVKLLMAAEVIEVKSYSVDRHFCRGFRFNPMFMLVGTVRLNLDTNVLGKDKLVLWTKDMIVPVPNEPVLSKTYLRNYMAIEFDPNGLDIVEKAKYKTAQKKLANVMAAETLDSFGNKDHGADINYDELYCRYGTGTGRMYTNISNFNKKFRYLLQYKNKSVSQVDCSACHPLMLIKHYQDAVDIGFGELKREREEYYGLFKGGGDFYLSIGNMAGILRKAKETDKLYRDRVKNDHYYSFLYDIPHDPKKCTLTKAYADNFPILLSRINYLKTNIILPPSDEVYARINDEPHTQFSFINLRMEGEIMIHGVAKELSSLKRHLWFTPIHDAVLCQKSNVPLVTTIMKKHFKRVLGVEAYFK